MQLELNHEKRAISSFSLLFTSISAILGSGWLFSAYYTAQIAGPSALLAWILGGISMIIIAYTFAEISAMIPVTGSTSRIPRYTHGAIVGYIYAWIIWLSYITLAPTEVQAVIQYFAYFFPQLTYPDGGLTRLGYEVAVVLMLMVTSLNVYSINWLIRSNNILTIFKIILPIFICLAILLVTYRAGSLVHPLHTHFFADGLRGVFSAISTGGIVFAFNGFKQACELAGEAHNPARAIPIAVIGSILVCLLIYVLLQVTLLSSLTPDNLSGTNWAALTIPGNNSPFAGLIGQHHQSWLLPFLYVAAIIGPLAAGLMYISSSARSLFSMSQNDYLPKFLEIQNKHHQPWVSVVICFACGMLAFAPLPGWKNMISFLGALMAASYVITPVCLITLRKQLPEYARPLKLPYATVWSLLAFYFCNLLSYWSGWDITKKMDICLLGSILLLLAYHFGTKRGRLLHLDWSASIWIWPYFAGMGCISYLGSFGGGRNIIPFGWDFAIMFVFSASILWLAVTFCLHAEKTKDYLVKQSEFIVP